MKSIIIFLVLGGLAIALIIGLFWLIKNALLTRYVVNNFKKRNVVVDGKKGSGKDLLFQKVINRRKDTYYANISYGGKCKLITAKDVSVSPNTYLQFINNKVEKVPRFFKEAKDIYISDGGIFLPSYMDATLYKQFPSFPIFYALSRHLYDNNVHVNVQNFTRLWKALREQADFYIHVHHTTKLFGFLFTKITTYEKYESACKYLEPLKARMLNKYSKAEVDIYRATNGEIRQGYIIQRVSKVRYNTRAFEKIVLKGRRKR